MSVSKKSIARINRLAAPNAKSTKLICKVNASTEAPTQLHKPKPTVRTLPPHLL
ncbi:MAG: hypothetical protein AB9856_06165 [Cellulosilyticaceae bacterium]